MFRVTHRAPRSGVVGAARRAVGNPVSVQSHPSPPRRTQSMNPVPELSPFLKQLRLSGILDSLEARNRQAIDSKLAYTEFLALLIQDEGARRARKKVALRLRRAAVRTPQTPP